MAGSNTRSFRNFQVRINRAQVISKPGGMGVTNGQHFFDDLIIQHSLLREGPRAIPVWKSGTN